MHAYVVNLARSRDRRAYITEHLGNLGIAYEVVTAVDGRDLDLDDENIIAPSFRNDVVTNVVLQAGSAGCSLSHIAIYKRIVEDGLDMALVLEDDVVLPPDLDALADEVGKELVGAEVALFSVDCPEPFKVSSRSAVQLRSSRSLALPIDVQQAKSAGAYVITRAACERMIERNVPIRQQADSWEFFYSEGFIDRVRCVVPVSVRKNPNFSSTIGSYRLSSGIGGRLIGVVMRHRIPILQQLMAYRRALIYNTNAVSEVTDAPFINKPSRINLLAFVS